jgi:hypothetical protein
MESSLQLILRRAARRERGGLDIAGFLAGCALSTAIGAVLYFCLTAG